MNFQTLREWMPTASQHFLIGALAVLCYVITTRLRGERRAAAAAIAWVMGLALVPYITLPMYLLFGRRKVRPPVLAHQHLAPGEQPWAADLLDGMGLVPASRSTVTWQHDGAAAQATLWRLIEQAEHRIDVCTFILGDDSLGQGTVERLSHRARNGVAVRVLLDGFGALLLPRHHLRALRQAGVQVAIFRPFFSLRGSGPRNLRNHRKLLLADDHWLWSGGRNLAAEYFTGKSGELPWRDISFTLDGGTARAAAEQFARDWATVQRQLPRALLAPVDTQGTAGVLTQFLPSGPDQAEDTAHALLLAACFQARRRILAITPYFVPDDGLRDALRLAARRGVEVTLVIPQKSNHRLADFVRSRAMRDLAQAGVQFRMLPFMAHAKALVLDDTLALCGSINIDLRSLLINHEASVVFYGPTDIAWLADWIMRTAHGAQPYLATPPGLVRDVAEGLVQAIAFQL